MLTAYNPFSFGFENEVYFEARSNEVLGELNRIASAAAGWSRVSRRTLACQ